MVILNLKKAVVIFTTAFTLLSTIISFSQNKVIKHKRIWGLTAKIAMFDKANIERQYGYIKYMPQKSYSYIFGFTFDFNINKVRTHVIKTGIYFGTIPVINGKFRLDKNDVSYYGEDFYFDEVGMNSYLITYLPIKYEYRINLYKNVLNFSIGPQFIYTPEFDVGEGLVISDNENGIDKEVYASYIETNSKIFMDIQSSIGLYYKVGKLAFNTELEYNLSLKEKFKGEYQFGNLNISEPTRGNMTINGNYLALSLTVSLMK